MIAMQSDNLEQNNLNSQPENYGTNPEMNGTDYSNMYQQPYDNNQMGAFNYTQNGNFDPNQNFINQGYMDPNGQPMMYMDPSQMGYMDPNGQPMMYMDPSQMGYMDPNGQPMMYMNPSQMGYMDPNGQPMMYMDPSQMGYMDPNGQPMMYMDPSQMGYMDPNQQQMMNTGYVDPAQSFAEDAISEMTGFIADVPPETPTEQPVENTEQVPSESQPEVTEPTPEVQVEQPEQPTDVVSEEPAEPSVETVQTVEEPTAPIEEVPQIEEAAPVAEPEPTPAPEVVAEPVAEEVSPVVEPEVVPVEPEPTVEAEQTVPEVPVTEEVQEAPQVEEVPQVVETVQTVEEPSAVVEEAPQVETPTEPVQAEVAPEVPPVVDAIPEEEPEVTQTELVGTPANETQLIDVQSDEEPTFIDQSQMYAGGVKPEYLEVPTEPEVDESKYVDINPEQPTEPVTEEPVETIQSETQDGLETVSSQEYHDVTVEEVVEENKPKEEPEVTEEKNEPTEEVKEEPTPVEEPTTELDVVPEPEPVVEPEPIVPPVDIIEQPVQHIEESYKPQHIDDDDEVEAFDARPQNINQYFNDPLQNTNQMYTQDFNQTNQFTKLDYIEEDTNKHKVNINSEKALMNTTPLAREEKVNTNDPRKNILHREPNNLKLSSKVNNFQFDAVGGISKEGEEKLFGFVKVVAVFAVVAILCYVFREQIYDMYSRAAKMFKGFYNEKMETISVLDELNNYEAEYYGGYVDYDETQNVHSAYVFNNKLDTLQNDSLSGNYIYKTLRSGSTAETSCSFKFGAAKGYKKAGGMILGVVNFFSGVKSSIKIEYYNEVKWFVYSTKSLNAGEGKVFATTEKNGVVYFLQYTYITKDNVALGGIAAREDECNSYYSNFIGGIK